MTYLVHINPTPGKDDRVVEVEANGFLVTETGTLVLRMKEPGSEHGAAFAPGIWNYVEPKK